MHAVPGEAILPRPFVEVIPLAPRATKAAEAEARDDPNDSPNHSGDAEDEAEAIVRSTHESDQRQERGIADE
jgi:hypothetical protein